MAVTASRDLVARHVHRLEQIDADARAELGVVYSEEAWTAQHFLAERPAKFRLSALALDGDVFGFWIASAMAEIAHTHRVAVVSDHRGTGVASALSDAVHARARDAGATVMTLYVHSANATALALYERLDYEVVEYGERLKLARAL